MVSSPSRYYTEKVRKSVPRNSYEGIDFGRGVARAVYLLVSQSVLQDSNLQQILQMARSRAASRRRPPCCRSAPALRLLASTWHPPSPSLRSILLLENSADSLYSTST